MKRFAKLALLALSICGVFFAALWAMYGTPWNAVCPGIQSRELEHLEPQLAAKVERITETLEDEGYTFRVSSTYRSTEKQQCYYKMSMFVREYTGRNGLTGTQRSCHNHRQDGEPASLASDIHLRYGSALAQALGLAPSRDVQVAFYTRLRELVRREGLKSGGDFKQKGEWAEYGLGWDPGHLQIMDCKNLLSTE